MLFRSAVERAVKSGDLEQAGLREVGAWQSQLDVQITQVGVKGLPGAVLLKGANRMNSHEIGRHGDDEWRVTDGARPPERRATARYRAFDRAHLYGRVGYPDIWLRSDAAQSLLVPPRVKVRREFSLGGRILRSVGG